MLNRKNLEDKNYEDMITEALSQIPLYSKEWTNTNISDPGVTILQNITAFHVLQQSYINQVTDEVKLKLLKLVGLIKEKNQCACVFLAAKDLNGERNLPMHQKFRLGDLCFETEDNIKLTPGKLEGVYSFIDEEAKEITYLLDKEIPSAVPVFGGNPKAGDALLLLLKELPGPGEEFSFYACTDKKFHRVPFEKNIYLPFARLQWQCYTEIGFVDVKVQDETCSFLASGVIKLTMPKEKPAIYSFNQVSGYAIRCEVKAADYDIPPKLNSLTPYLFPVHQKDTKAASFSFHGTSRVEVFSHLAAFDCIDVFCLEGMGEEYYSYEEVNSELNEKGRFYRKTKLEDNRILFEFSYKDFGYAPAERKEAIRIVCYSEEVVLHKFLDKVYGYDNQVIESEYLKNVYEDGFTLLAEYKNLKGETVYSFLKPEEKEEDKLFYQLLPVEGKIVINNPGLGEECKLYLSDCALTKGEEGNVREDNTFILIQEAEKENMTPPVSFFNPSRGFGGKSSENMEQLQQRFTKDMKTPSCAVLASDYEHLVKNTPGLCLHKVKAVVETGKNIVKVVVKPHSSQPFPTLSPIYSAAIKRNLEIVRILTTKVILQQPVYVPIHVKGTIYVKSNYQDAKKIIEEAIYKELDYISSDHNFGETVRFNKIFQMLEALDAVEYVYDLKLIPQRKDVTLIGSDIKLADYCLCYPGEIDIEINYLLK